MVHASLRAIGPVEGGASGVLDALELAVGPGGTLLMLLGAGGVWEAVDDADEVRAPPALTLADAFDRRSSPAYPEVGYLAEAFRIRPGTLVTDHPGGRFGARGRRAAELLANAPWHHYYGPGSPLEHLCDAAGRVLRLGADENTVTVLHWAEYLARVREKRRVRRHYAVRAGAVVAIRHVDSLDDGEGIVDWPGEDYFARILRDYLATGRGERGRVGGARSELLDARDLVSFGARWMAEHFQDADR